MELQRVAALTPAPSPVAWPRCASTTGPCCVRARSSSRPVPAGATWGCRARRTTATRASPSARTATGRCSRASGSRSSAAATRASRRRSTWPASSATSPSWSSSTNSRADAVLQRKLLQHAQRRGHPQRQDHRGASGNGEQVTGLDYEDRTTGEAKHLDLDGVFVQIGLLPNTDWLGEAVEFSPRKEVVIDERGQTSAPGIFAAGDCTTPPTSRSSSAWAPGRRPPWAPSTTSSARVLRRRTG
jgi:hypothetical protein